MVTASTDIDVAARALLAGHLVALPTETVYGLAARADNPNAVERIYAAKGRPRSHPLIVHVADVRLDRAMPNSWISAAPDYAVALASQCWPGPMTLVLPRSARAIDEVTGGQDTVAIRVPSHPMARAVLSAMDAIDPAGAPHGVAAPSANRFGRVSPTCVDHVLAELADVLDPTVDLVLDGGVSDVGVESTIIDCTSVAPRVLRPGGVSADRIAQVTGLPVLTPETSTIRVPGALPSHYAPEARVVVSSDVSAAVAATDGERIGLLAPARVATPDGVVRLASPLTSREYAHELYAALREADRLSLTLVIAVPPDDDSAGLAAAVCDRLSRAASTKG